MTGETTNKWRVLLDLNIILDVLMSREPHLTNAARIWALAETGQVDGMVAGHSLTTLFYLYRKQGSPEKAYHALHQLLRVFQVAGIDQAVIEQASALAWRDFEDAVQFAAAVQAGCQYLVTRNPGDFPNQDLTVIQPADFLALWAGRG